MGAWVGASGTDSAGQGRAGLGSGLGKALRVQVAQLKPQTRQGAVSLWAHGCPVHAALHPSGCQS